MLTHPWFARSVLLDRAARGVGAFVVVALVGWVNTAAAAPAGTGASSDGVTSSRSLLLPTPTAPEYEPPPRGEEPEPPPSEPPAYEPPPSPWPPSALSPTPTPRQTAQALPPPAPRFYFELGLGAAALVSRRVYGFGGYLDLGARYRLPFGALGVALRLGLEQHLQPEPAPFVVNLGVAITYLIGRPHWRVSPYFGGWAQGMLQQTPDRLGAFTLQRNEGGLTLGGLAGAQLRLGRGGIFTELGYRHTAYRHTAAAMPAWNVVQLLLGYRFTTK